MEPSTPQLSKPDPNGLGIAGFVISLVGLCSGGLLSPIGLILSLVALGKPPRGFAIAGAVIGAVGSCGIIVGLLFFIPVLVAVLIAVGLSAFALALAGPKLEAQIEMGIIESRIEEYQAQHVGEMPPTLDALALPNAGLISDHWNQPYIYQIGPDGKSYVLFSTGPDKLPQTADDIQTDPDWKDVGSRIRIGADGSYSFDTGTRGAPRRNHDG